MINRNGCFFCLIQQLGVLSARFCVIDSHLSMKHFYPFSQNKLAHFLSGVHIIFIHFLMCFLSHPQHEIHILSPTWYASACHSVHIKDSYRILAKIIVDSAHAGRNSCRLPNNINFQLPLHSVQC